MSYTTSTGFSDLDNAIRSRSAIGETSRGYGGRDPIRPSRRLRLIDQDIDTGVDEAWEARFLGGVMFLAALLIEILRAA